MEVFLKMEGSFSIANSTSETKKKDVKSKEVIGTGWIGMYRLLLKSAQHTGWVVSHVPDPGTSRGR